MPIENLKIFSKIFNFPIDIARSLCYNEHEDKGKGKTKMKTLKWTGAKGNEIELRTECKITMVDDIVDADGWKVNVGKKEKVEAMLEVYVDGKKVDSSWNIAFWKIIDIGNGLKRIWGIEKIAFREDRAEIIGKFLSEVIEAGKSEEAKEAEAARAAEEKAQKIAYAEKVLKAAETTVRNRDGSLMTEAQAEAWKKRYNDINNEGGFGFVPGIITKEMVDAANAILKNN